MSQSQRPNGPCPDAEKLFTALSAIIDEVGAHNLSFRTLRNRLEADFNVNLEPHRQTLNQLVEKKLRQPKTFKALKDHEKELKEGLVMGGIGRRKGKGKGSRKKKSRREGDGSPTKRERKEKKSKPASDEPKKPLSAFFLFSNDVRLQVVSENPGAAPPVIMTKVGAMWKEASNEVRTKYEELAEKDKARYQLECEAYRAKGGKITGRSGKVVKEKKEKTGPKKPTTAFFYFVASLRQSIVDANPGMKPPEVVKIISEKWNALTPEQKQPFEQQAIDDRKRYEKECADAGISLRQSTGVKRSRKEAASSSSDSDSDSDSSSSDSSSDSSSSDSSSSDSDSSSSSSSSDSD